MSDTLRYDFISDTKPSTNQFAVKANGKTFNVTYQDHHVIASETYHRSSLLKKLAEHGLWNQRDFKLNGMQMVSSIL